MKKFVLIFFALISITTLAQEGRSPQGVPNGEMPKREKPSVDEQIKKMTTELNLTEIQQLQVREILVEQEKKREVFAPKKEQFERPNREEMEAKILEERKISDEKFKKVLTPEQFTKWSERKQDGEMPKPPKKKKGKDKSKRKSKKENAED